MDLFGKQARKELEQLREKLNALELRHSNVVARYNANNAELVENRTLMEEINAARKSKAYYTDEKYGYEQKAFEFDRKTREIASKEAELLAAYEAKKASITNELRESEGKVSAIKSELEGSQKRAKALEKELQTKERKRDTTLTEIEKLKDGMLEAEAALRASQEKQTELAAAVAKLTRQQEALAGSNQHLSQLTSHLNRPGDEDTVFASLEHDLHRFLTHDRTSGAMQVTLEAMPLLLVVDFGYDSVNFATLHAGLLSGGSEISLHFESRKIVKNIGGSRIETVFAAWLWERFTTVHPRLKKSVKKQKGVELCLPASQRLLALICQGAPQGELEENIIIDSEPFSASIPLMREELVSVFLPLLGPEGELTGTIRRFLAEFKLSVEAIDRVVCMGFFGQLPLVGAALINLFKQPVLVPDFLSTLALAKQNSARPVTVASSNEKRASVIMSDPKRTKKERKDRLRYEKELVARLTKERIEQEERERREQAERERLARKEQERQEREILEKEKLKDEEDRQKRAEREHKASVKRKIESSLAYFSCPVTHMEFVFVRGGTFHMGDLFSPRKSDHYIKHYMPVQEVTVSDFLIGKYPVTQGEWKKIMGNIPSSENLIGDRYPVVSVGYTEVQAFIKKLNQQASQSYRLPTEAEWEYAARSGGKRELFSGGNNADDVAWYEDNSDERYHPVGLKMGNGLGIHDMSGNVAEWVSDWYLSSEYFPQITVQQHNPQGPTSSHHTMRGLRGDVRVTRDLRVIRGGCYFQDKDSITTVFRDYNEPEFRRYFIGFRLASPAR